MNKFLTKVYVLNMSFLNVWHTHIYIHRDTGRHAIMKKKKKNHLLNYSLKVRRRKVATYYPQEESVFFTFSNILQTHHFFELISVLFFCQPVLARCISERTCNKMFCISKAWRFLAQSS